MKRRTISAEESKMKSLQYTQRCIFLTYRLPNPMPPVRVSRNLLKVNLHFRVNSIKIGLPGELIFSKRIDEGAASLL